MAFCNNNFLEAFTAVEICVADDLVKKIST